MMVVSKYGARAQAFRKDNPLTLLGSIVEENAGASAPVLLDLFMAALEERPELIDTIVEYWFVNNLTRLRREYSSRRPLRPLREEIDAVKEQISLRLLDLVLPSGTKLADSTGPECQKAGGWLIEVGRRAGPNVVGAVLSEEQVLDIWLNRKGRP